MDCFEMLRSCFFFVVFSQTLEIISSQIWGLPLPQYTSLPWTGPIPNGARRLENLPSYEGLRPFWQYGYSSVTESTYPPTTEMNTEPSTAMTVSTPFPLSSSAYTSSSSSPFSSSWLNFRRYSRTTTNKPEPTSLGILSKEEPSTTVQSILGLFNIVRFNHFSCDAENGQNGSCYTVNECRQRGGSSSKPCAMGFGVCCLFNASCGNRITRNITYFTNPSFPQSYSADGSCSVTIPKPRTDICQLRLDFVEFDILHPNAGDCNSDRLVVSGQNANHVVPPICGLNTGQHVYVDIDMSQGPVQLNMLTSGPGARKWNIRVLQIPCNANYRAPANCLQYFTGVKGNFKSFNYDEVSNPGEEGYLNNLDYMICMRKEAGFCNIAYTNGDLPGQYQFSIMNVDKLGMPLLPPDLSGSGSRDCPDDYINLNGTPLCGDRLNADMHLPNHAMDKPVIVNYVKDIVVYKTHLTDTMPLRLTIAYAIRTDQQMFEKYRLDNLRDSNDSTPGQFMVRFHSDQSTTSRGFNLTFQQFPCGSISGG